jgi:hypothetical protein
MGVTNAFSNSVTLGGTETLPPVNLLKVSAKQLPLRCLIFTEGKDAAIAFPSAVSQALCHPY